MKKILISAFALVIAFIAAYFLFFNEPDYDKLIGDAFQPYPNVITSSTRSEADATGQVDRVMALYDKQKYADALKEFDKYIQDNPQDYNVLFYRGITHMKMDQSESAVADFEEVISGNSLLHDQAEWYLGLAYLKNNQKKEAADLFFAIAGKDTEYSEKANTIVNKIPYKSFMNKEIEAMN